VTVIKHFVDVLEIAVRIERKGLEFYRRLYDTIDSPKAKRVFSYLAAEEEKHAGLFVKMLEKTADYQPRYEYPGEYGLFLNEMAAGIIKNAGDRRATDLNDAIQAGIELEKESVLFYLELKQEGNFGRENEEILQAILDEERSHWKKLVSLRDGTGFLDN